METIIIISISIIIFVLLLSHINLHAKNISKRIDGINEKNLEYHKRYIDTSNSVYDKINNLAESIATINTNISTIKNELNNLANVINNKNIDITKIKNKLIDINELSVLAKNILLQLKTTCADFATIDEVNVAKQEIIDKIISHNAKKTHNKSNSSKVTKNG